MNPPGLSDEPGLLAALVELSRTYGANPELVIAGGGNTSVKFDDHLLVKASGAALSSIGPDGFVDLDRAALQTLLDTDLSTSRKEREAGFRQAVMAARREPDRMHRPSIESVLHHLMPNRFVVHLHATLVNEFSCCREGYHLVEGELGDDVVWVPHVDPGFALAKALQQQLRAFQLRTGRDRPRAVVLENHGLVVAGERPTEVSGHIEWLLQRLSEIKARASVGSPRGAGQHAVRGLEARALSVRVAHALADLLSTADEPPKVLDFDNSDVVVDFVTSDNGRDLAMGGPVTPDQIVYCRSFPLWIATSPGEPADDLERRLEAAVSEYSTLFHTRPSVVLVQGLGLFAAGDAWPEASTARLVYVDTIKVMTGASRMGGVNYLNEDFITFIENWEAQSYRRYVSRTSA